MVRESAVYAEPPIVEHVAVRPRAPACFPQISSRVDALRSVSIRHTGDRTSFFSVSALALASWLAASRERPGGIGLCHPWQWCYGFRRESSRAARSWLMQHEIPSGTERVIDGRLRVYYDGYWIKAYEVPADTLLAKKKLIEALTRRLFNHVEHGLNVPGQRLREARQAYDSETDPRRRRVKGAMLAGALFNRAADIFTKLVDIQALGVEIQPDNALMRECGRHLQEALTLGKLVMHRSGEEGIDELWGEPFKAFCFPIEEFYKSRYAKIALTMRDIDRIASELIETLEPRPSFSGIEPLVRAFAEAAKAKCETLRTDSDIFELWTSFAVSAELLGEFEPHPLPPVDASEQRGISLGLELICRAKTLVVSITRARVPMPKSTHDFAVRCEQYRELYGNAAGDSARGGRAERTARDGLFPRAGV